MSWIGKFCKAFDEVESPENFVYWSAIATLSAVAAPNVYINREGKFKLCPNVFIMFIAESGLGKGFPVYVSSHLVNMTGATRVISGRNTMASIIKELGTSETDEATGKPKFKDARGYVITGELTTLTQKSDDALSIFTDWYDKQWHDTWKNSTKVSGVDTLISPSITFLGASTPEHFLNTVPEADINGGFVGRILTVYAESRARFNPLINTEKEDTFPYTDLAMHLMELKHLKGGFSFSKPATKYFTEWYYMIRGKKIYNPTGTVNRLPDNVLKIAMCLSMSRGTDMIISLDDIEEAINKCMELTIDSRRLTEGKGTDELAEGTKLVMHTLLKVEGHRISKSKLLQMHYGTFDVMKLDRIIATLEASGTIRCEPEEVTTKHGKKTEMTLIMLAETLERLQRFMEM